MKAAVINITFGYLESRDTVAAVRFLRMVSDGKPIVVIGTSLGGAAAVLAQPALHVQAAILEETRVAAFLQSALRGRPAG